MKKTFLILFVFFSLFSRAQKRESLHNINVLFIGNSLTYYQDMPQTVQMMVNETHPTIKIEQITFPGISLFGHLNEIITARTKDGIKTRLK